MTTYYRKISGGNWDDANGWNTLANGTGSDYTAGGSESGNTFDLNALACTLNLDVTCTLITSANSAGYLTISGTRVLTANTSYSSTSTSGMLRMSGTASLTQYGQMSWSSSGNPLVTTSTGAVTISNVGGTAISATGTGYIYFNAAATVTITGNISTTSSNYVIWNTSATTTITGDLASTYNTATTDNGIVHVSSGSVTVNGNMASVSSNTLRVAGGSAYWVGSRTLAADKACRILVDGGTMYFYRSSDQTALSLANSGQFMLRYCSGTITATNATITNQSATAQAAQIGTSAVTVTGPTLPTASNVWTGTGTYGYAGSPITPTKVASSITNCSAGNIKKDVVIGDVTGNQVVPAATDVRYGTNVGTTTGTCYVPAATDVREGVSVDATVGSYYEPAADMTTVADGSLTAYLTWYSGYPITGVGTSYFKMAGDHVAEFTATGVRAEGTANVDGLYAANGEPTYADGETTVPVTTAPGSWESGGYVMPGDVTLPTDADVVQIDHTCTLDDAAVVYLRYRLGVAGSVAITGTGSLSGADGQAITATPATWPEEYQVISPVAYGPTGTEYTGTVDMDTYVLKSSVVSTDWIVSGQYNWPGGDAGTYPTTETSYNAGWNDGVVAGEANQLVADQAAVDAALDDITSTRELLGRYGRLYMSLYVLKTDVVSGDWVVTGNARFPGGGNGTYPTTATSKAEQLSTDQASVEAAKADIKSTRTLLGVTGTLNMSLYVLAESVVAADWVVVGYDRFPGGGHGTYPTTATSKAEQLAEDQAAVGAVKDRIQRPADGGPATVLGTVTGTLNTAMIVSAAFAEGQADQLATDQAAVEAVKDSIYAGVVVLGVEGTGLAGDGYSNPDVANVKLGVSYLYAGEELTGTYELIEDGIGTAQYDLVRVVSNRGQNVVNTTRNTSIGLKARIVDDYGDPIGQAGISGIAYTIYDQTGTAVEGYDDVSISLATVLAEYSTDGWRQDEVGYNWAWTLTPGIGAFPSVGQVYTLAVRFDLASGKVSQLIRYLYVEA